MCQFTDSKTYVHSFQIFDDFLIFPLLAKEDHSFVLILVLLQQENKNKQRTPPSPRNWHLSIRVWISGGVPGGLSIL